MSTQAIGSILNREVRRWFWGLGCLGVLVIGGCGGAPPPAPRQVRVQQTWELQPGATVAGFRVAASLGDISLDLSGAPVRAPFSGEVELAALAPDCILFSSPEVPAYLFRYCGLRRSRLGSLQAGQTFGSAQVLHFATLRRQPDGTWAIVEPSSHILERSLRPDP